MMNYQSVKMTLVGFLGGVAFIVGCGGGGATNSAIANTTAQVQDIEEMYCMVGVDGGIGYNSISSTLNDHFYSSPLTKPGTYTYAEQYPNHKVLCATMAATEHTETTLAALQQGGWKTYNATGAGYSSKVWRTVLR
jgi:hypothetical protein